MFNRKNIIEVLFASIVIIILGFQIGIAQDSYYYGLGQQPLFQCDSIITVKFDPAAPLQHSETFALLVDALDEAFSPEPMYIGFDVYHLNDGHNIDSLLTVLNERTDVLYAYPSYYDSTETVLKLNDQFLIQYYDTVSQSTIDNIENQYSVELISGPDEYIGMRLMRVTSNSPGTCLEIANAFYESDLVYYSHPDFACTELYDFEPNDPLFEYQYNLSNEGQTGGTPGIDIGMKKAWEIEKGDPSAIIAIIDDGFVRYHQDVEIDVVKWFQGYDFAGDIINKYDPDDNPIPGVNQNHGVACQGIINAKINNGFGVAGIAPESPIIPIKCFDNTGSPAGVSVFKEAIIYAVNCPAYILSCSWGWLPGIYWPAIDSAINYAVYRDRICVFSSGNTNGSISFPANLPTTIAVGAIKKDGARWVYSGHGPELDVVAPSGYAAYDAGDIYTLDQTGDLGYNPEFVSCMNTTTDYLCSFGGTSAAAPQVAAIASLIKSNDRYVFGFENVRDILRNSAVDEIGDQYDTPGFDNYYGYGLVNANRALLAITRGDVNNDGEIDIIDITILINYKYKGGTKPVPDVALGDTDCDGTISIIDIVTLINYKYKGADAPPFCFIYDYPEEE